MKVIMINGPMGVGKTAVGRCIAEKYPGTAFIDGDWCMDIHPFVGNPETKKMAVDNILHMIGNYQKCAACERVVVAWLMDDSWVRRDIAEGLSALHAEVNNVTLICGGDHLVRRWNRDHRCEWRTEEWLKVSLKSLPLFSAMENTIDTGHLTVEQVADVIMKDAADPESGLNERATVRKQYSTPDKLNTRISVHSKYSTNRQGFGNWISSHYQIREGMSVLELGCGTGEMWIGKEDMIHRCSRFVLSDFSEGMLDKAKETLRDVSGIEYRVIDIRDIPFENDSFDVVIANMMLYHVPDLPRGLREVRRILKDDGTFYCATYGENGMMAYIRSLFRDDQVRNQVNRNFTLQNGGEKLRPFFSDIRKDLYEDALEVTDVEDMVDYIFSLAGMTDLRKIPRSEVRAVLEKHTRSGILHVPKEYGMFMAGKRPE